MKFEGRWIWCEVCNTSAIRCDKCGHMSCDAGGCAECDADFKEVFAMKKKGEAPTSPDGLPVHKNPWDEIENSFGSAGRL